MHEGHFTEQIVEAILAELQKYPDKSPTRVHVKVGETYHLVPESVLAHFKAQSRGTRLEAARLELEEVPLALKCRACGFTGLAEDHHFLVCARCAGREVDVTAGNTVVIDAIDLRE